MSDRKFFNEAMETLSKDKLKALQLERLQTIVNRAYAQNQFYRNLYDEAGVKPSDIKALEDIQKLPFLEKKTVREAYPYGMAFKKPGDEGGPVETVDHLGERGPRRVEVVPDRRLAETNRTGPPNMTRFNRTVGTAWRPRPRSARDRSLRPPFGATRALGSTSR